jgi:hypothetical protein
MEPLFSAAQAVPAKNNETKTTNALLTINPPFARIMLTLYQNNRLGLIDT